MSLQNITPTTSKAQAFEIVKDYLVDLGFSITEVNAERPWGGYYVVNENEQRAFIARYFPELDVDTLHSSGKLRAKILIIEPHKRFSWQYHNRRGEIWKALTGPLALSIAETDDQPTPTEFKEGQLAQFGIHTRHRLGALDNWGIIAEIWQHADPEHPSDEPDVVHVQDDFGRK